MKGHCNLTLFFAFCMLMLLVSHLNAQELSLREAYEQSRTAKEEQDTILYLKMAISAQTIHPTHPIVLTNLAEARILSGNTQGLTGLIRQILMKNSEGIPSNDTLLLPYVDPEDLKEIDLERERLSRSMETSEPFIELDRTEIHGESLTRVKDSWYVTDILQPRIYQVDPEGQSNIFYERKDSLFTSLTGLKFDPLTNTFWVAAANFAEGARYQSDQKGHSALIQLDLSGNQLRIFSKKEDQLWGDLHIDPEGNVFITNSLEPEIYRYDSELQSLELFSKIPDAVNLQGIVLDQKNDQLILSDYIRGLLSFSLTTRQVRWLKTENELIIPGVDGIALRGSELFLAQNGTHPKRISTVSITSEGIANYQLIDNGIFDNGEPTHLIIDQNKVYFIANSPWPLYEDSQPELEKWRPLVIRVIPD